MLGDAESDAGRDTMKIVGTGCDDSLSLDSRGTTGVRRLQAWRTRRGAEKTRRGAAWRYDRTRLQPRMSGARTGGALDADRLDVGASRRMSQRWTV